jgi:Ca2+-binding EF-hand superfamily protein
MGNKVCRHNRIILTSDIALNFKSSNLVRDVLPLIERWQQDGSEMCLSLESFKETFDVVNDDSARMQFNTFDIKRTGKVDACEVIMVYTLLSQGELTEKVEAVFSVFSFENSQGANGTISFDEAMIILTSCVKGPGKVCNTDFEIPDNEIEYHVKSLFDLHRTGYDRRITRKQFDEWVWHDPSPRSFLKLFHDAQGLPDILAQVKVVNAEQGHVFQVLANGQFHVLAKDLEHSRAFKDTLQDPSPSEMRTLLRLMQQDSQDGRIHLDSYHATLRPWNIFNECDLDGDRNLDEKEVEILLWIQLRRRPTPEMVQEFTNHIDCDSDGGISRQEWVRKMVENKHTHAAAEERRRQSIQDPEEKARARLSMAAWKQTEALHPEESMMNARIMQAKQEVAEQDDEEYQEGGWRDAPKHSDELTSRSAAKMDKNMTGRLIAAA